MKRRVFWGGVLISLFLTLLLIVLIEHTVFNELENEIHFSQSIKTLQLAAKLNSSDNDILVLKNAVTDERVVLINRDGELLFDNKAPLSTNENFSDLPEIIDASSKGMGKSVRKDTKTGADIYYNARRLVDGNILRISRSDTGLEKIRSNLILYFIVVYIIIVLISSFSSKYITEIIAKNIEKISFDNPVDTCVYEELLPFTREMNTWKNEYLNKIEEIKSHHRQTEAIINGMGEGFVILDGNLNIVSINKSAGAILGVDIDFAQGRPLVAITRQKEIMQLLNNLERQDSSFVVAHIKNSMYRVAASIVTEGERGAVLLFTDLTDKLEAENMRKRFTANVSHELRTPLTTISGYTEMLTSGMVKSADQAVFLERINKEAKRMLHLVEDIMRLSKMDEGNISDKHEYIKLMDVVKSCAESLRPVAEKKQVDIKFSGDAAFIYGDETLVGEIVFNLMDNAIKYNKTGGSVHVHVRSQGEQSVLTVRDNGIGIAKEHQDKIFERFYRTDSSRSKETGGTGLGLSIVKHAVEHHKAKLNVESDLGVGTTMTVVFPVKPQANKQSY
ncbi:MAG: ATP-binding protein [Eubacteriales bacterium]|nr:ATP-binding protein [Eubacteriales bacterium]